MSRYAEVGVMQLTKNTSSMSFFATKAWHSRRDLLKDGEKGELLGFDTDVADGNDGHPQHR